MQTRKFCWSLKTRLVGNCIPSVKQPFHSHSSLLKEKTTTTTTNLLPSPLLCCNRLWAFSWFRQNYTMLPKRSFIWKHNSFFSFFLILIWSLLFFGKNVKIFVRYKLKCWSELKLLLRLVGMNHDFASALKKWVPRVEMVCTTRNCAPSFQGHIIHWGNNESVQIEHSFERPD